jgi:4-diphosphocytidyl-2-C-methyl-D-erythritol kinase
VSRRRVVRAKAPAKVNLYLDILGSRKDGYHRIETLFQAISLYDDLRIETAPDGAPLSLKVLNSEGKPMGEACPADGRNIVWKAAERFLARFRPGASCRIVLTKRIPIQAGLGGGSSDAAATLKALSGIFLGRKANHPSIRADLHRMATALGADVPFFLEGGCAKATGIGETITPLPAFPKFWAVVVKPRIGCPTKDVYRWFDERFGTGPRIPAPKTVDQSGLTCQPKLNKIYTPISQKRPLKVWVPCLYNRFEEVVFAQFPELERIKRSLMDAGAQNALLSGSGSALYGIFPSKEKGGKALARLQGRHEGAWLVRSV